MKNNHVLPLRPQFKERIWGGTALRGIYGAAVPDGVFGEAWLASAVPGSESIVAAGPYAGQSILELWKDRSLFPGAEGDFPLLTKLIDAGDRLSVQVHPDDTFARIHENGRGKSECWYVIASVPGAELVVGHRATSREEFATAAHEGRLESLLHHVPVVPGDFVSIPAGTLHAIGAGIILLENQQTSDITYRIYDYGRIDSSGRPRQLHLDRGIAVTDIPARPVHVIHADGRDPGSRVLLEGPYFTIRKLVVVGSWTETKPSHRFVIAVVASGTATCGGFTFTKGDAFLIPGSVPRFDIEGTCELILSSPREVAR